MDNKRKILFLVFIAMSNLLFSQTQQIDSLVNLLPTTKGEAKVRLLAKLAYMNLSNSADECEKYVEILRTYSAEIDYPRGEALANNIQGLILNSKGNYRKALGYFNEALQYFSEVQDTNAISRTYINLAICHHELGHFNEAISFYQRASEIAKKQNDKEGLCLTLLNMGVVYSDWGKIEFALENYRTSLSHAKAIGHQKYIAINLLNIGVQLRKQNKYDSALIYFEKSLQIRQKMNDEEGVFTVLINKGELFKDMDRIDDAIAQFEMALQKSKELSNENDLAEASLNLGRTYLLANRLIEAESNLTSALEIAKRLDDQKLIQEAYKALSEYFYIIGYYQNAFQYFQYYTEIKDSIFNQESRKDLAEMQTIYEMDKKERELENQNLKNEQLRLRFLLTILGVLLLILFTWLLFNRYKLRQKQFRLELGRKNIEIEQRLLRTQMNPHFIFNSLNSINSFVIDNNVDAAQSFLSKFAKLMRSILENSRLEMVSLEEEVTALKLNMELEQLRFDYKFGFIINVDESFDAEFTFVPPMLIQPFIENAILHGMATLKRKGFIQLNIKKEDHLFLCEIIDNGIGRDASSKYKKVNSGKKRKSLGMQVTKERLEMLSLRFKNESIGFQIIDMYSENRDPIGTRVELRIPFEEE